VKTTLKKNLCDVDFGQKPVKNLEVDHLRKLIPAKNLLEALRES